MKRALLSFFGLLSLSSPAFAEDEGFKVVELFTSQSCSSCPPADKVLSKLEQEDGIIALSCNVTYWNHLHWEDTLSKDFCTQRQRDYAQNFASRNVYTPQAVINGDYETVGSNESKVRGYLDRAKPAIPISLTLDGNSLSYSFPDRLGVHRIIVLPYGAAHTQDIPSGENRGTRVTYTNPVQAIIDIHGDGPVDVSNFGEAKGFAMLASDSRGRILAAGKITR